MIEFKQLKKDIKILLNLIWIDKVMNLNKIKKTIVYIIENLIEQNESL